MSGLLNDLKQNILILGISLAFGFLCIAPSFIFSLDPAVGFRGVILEGTDAEYHYAARVREVQDGFWFTSNVYYGDHKDQPYLQPPVPEWAVALLAKLFHLGAANAIRFSQFIFGALVIFVMMGCFSEISGRRRWSIFAVSIFLLTGIPFLSWYTFYHILFGGQGMLEFLPFSRPINPQWSGLLFYGALWASTRWYRTGSRMALAWAAIGMALSFYSYIYIWTLYLSFMGLLGAYSLFCKEYRRVKDLTIFFLALFLAAFPYVLNAIRASRNPWYQETVMRLGLVHGRTPVVGSIVLILLILPWLFWGRLGKNRVGVASLAWASLIVLNQQLVTGVSVVPAHYHWYFIKPITGILCTILFGSWVGDLIWKNNSSLYRWRFPLATIVVLVAFFWGGMYQYRSYQFARIFWTDQQKAAGVLQRMNQERGKRIIVYADGFLRDLIPIYTSADVYTATNAFSYFSSDDRARAAYFFDLWLQGISAEEAAQTLPTARRAELSSHLHAIYYHAATGANQNIPDQEVGEAVQVYARFLRLPLSEKLHLYPLTDLVFQKTLKDSRARAELRTVSVLVYEDPSFEWRRILP